MIARQQILDSSKLKEFADNNFKFDENGGKFSKWVVNIVGKVEIAPYKKFLLFPQCFQMTCTVGIVWERVKITPKKLLKTLWEKEEMLVTSIFPFYTPVKDGTYYGITCGRRAGRQAGGVPIHCPEHISKTMLALVIKFCG